MSLAVLADHMASKGRGPDTMLVHMAPEEVRGLQALAVSHGGSLTINPETGLPEAGFLKKLLPTIIGFGISYLSGGTIDPMTAGMIVGGVETARTGDIGKGISAGLGAYGGAGLGAGLAGAGTAALTTAGTTAGMGGSFADQIAAQGFVPGTDAFTEAFGRGASEVALKSQADALATPFADKLSAGFNAATASPQAATSFLKDNAKNLMYAAGPAVMAGANVESKLPQTVTRPGMIRPYTYDPYGGTYAAGTPYEATARAAGGGLMGMADGGYNPGVLDFAQRSEPVVRMASGGIAHFDGGGGVTDEELRQQAAASEAYYEALRRAQMAATTPAPAPQPDYYADQQREERYTPPSAPAATTPAPVANAPAAPEPTPAPVATTFAPVVTTPAPVVTTSPADTSGFTTGSTQVGPGPDTSYQMSGFQGETREYTPEQRIGINQAFIRSQQDAGYGIQGLLSDMEKYGVTAKDLALSQGLGQHSLNQYLIRGGAAPDFMGINKDWDIEKQDEFIKRQNAAPNPYGQGTLEDVYKAQGISDNDPRRRAQAQEILEREEARKSMRNMGFILSGGVVGPGPDGGGGGTTPSPDRSVVTPGPIDVVPNVPPGVSGGSNTVVNPNGTVTTTPDIPGRPEGGFTGMKDVRDAYTAGGGSLGYTPYVPTSMADFNAKYNTQTGGSAQKFDELLGKTAYSPTPYTPTGELFKPYYESVGGVPANIKTKKYLFKDGKYVLNPDYEPLSYDSKGNRVIGSSTTQSTKGFATLEPAQTQENFDHAAYLKANPEVQAELDQGIANFGTKNDLATAAYNHYTRYGKNDGRAFTSVSGAKPADNAIFAWADTNKVSDQQLATLIGISVADVAERRKKYKKPEEITGTGSYAGDAAGDAGGTGPSAAPGPGRGSADGTGVVATGGLVPQHMATRRMALGGLGALAGGGSASQYNLGGYSDGGRLLRGPGDGVSDSIPATIGNKRPARLADGEFVVPARIVSELGNGSTEAGARKLYAMMDRVQKARGSTTGKGRVAKNSRADKYLPA